MLHAVTRLAMVWPFLGAVDGERVIMALLNWLAVYGIPTILQSDNGSEFVNHKADEFLEARGIRHHRSSVAQPKSKGCIERRHSTLGTFIKAQSSSGSHDLRQDPVEVRIDRLKLVRKVDRMLSSECKCRTIPDNFSGEKTTAHHDLYESRWLGSTPQSTLQATMKTSAGLAARGGCFTRNSQHCSAMYNWVCSWMFDVEFMRYLGRWGYVGSAHRE